MYAVRSNLIWNRKHRVNLFIPYSILSKPSYNDIVHVTLEPSEGSRHSPSCIMLTVHVNIFECQINDVIVNHILYIGTFVTIAILFVSLFIFVDIFGFEFFLVLWNNTMFSWFCWTTGRMWYKSAWIVSSFLFRFFFSSFIARTLIFEPVAERLENCALESKYKTLRQARSEKCSQWTKSENYLLPVGKNVVQNFCDRALLINARIQSMFLFGYFTNFSYHYFAFSFC